MKPKTGRKGIGHKGQAALEYLMTYGWAILIILAILVVIGTFVWPQITQAQSSESCAVTLPFQCVSGYYSIDKGGNLTLRLQNIGTTRYLVNATQCGIDAPVTVISPEKSLTAGNYVDLTFNCASKVDPNAVAGKDTFKEDVSITYYPPEGKEMYTKVQRISLVVKYK